MSGLLQYYEDEDKLFKRWLKAKLTPEEASAIIKKLRRHYKMSPIKVTYRHGKELWSWAISETEENGNSICLNATKLNWLLVVHEFAHLLLDWNIAQGLETPKRFFHCPEHRLLVQEILDYAAKRGWYKITGSGIQTHTSKFVAR